jgi:hypothetical protein
MSGEIAGILAGESPSIYIYGSVSLDDFKPGWSDIDILVLTQKKISREQAETLVDYRQKLLERYPGDPYFRLFEGGMLSLNAFVTKEPATVVYWGTSGQRITDKYDFNSFSMLELLDSGVLVFGGDIRGGLTRPSYGDLRRDAARHYDAVRKHGKGVGWLLDTARCIYTLRTGKIIAKTRAGEWALEQGLCPAAQSLEYALKARKEPMKYDHKDSSEKLFADIQAFAGVLKNEFASTARLFAESELREMGTSFDKLTEMQYKDGVSLWRVKDGERSLVLKCFDTEDYRREIGNYQILASLGVPTLSVAAHTSASLLLEDINRSEYRLGVEADLSSADTAALIAEWYRKLHTNGKSYAQTHELYDETDVITRESLQKIKEKTNTADLPVWTEIENNFDCIIATIKAPPRTLTYNDFYYTNLAVKRDGSAAIMYDYNLLGKGYAYSDLRNVCSSLGSEANAAFLAAYGAFDEREILIDDVAGVLTALHFACQREHFPKWAGETLRKVTSGELSAAVRDLLNAEKRR